MFKSNLRQYGGVGGPMFVPRVGHWLRFMRPFFEVGRDWRGRSVLNIEAPTELKITTERGQYVMVTVQVLGFGVWYVRHYFKQEPMVSQTPDAITKPDTENDHA